MKHNNHPKGHALPQAKLNEDIVRRVRHEYHEAQSQIQELRSKASINALSERYGVDRKTMRTAVMGDTWAHVK